MKEREKEKNSCIPRVSPLILCTLKVCQLNPKTLPVPETSIKGLSKCLIHSCLLFSMPGRERFVSGGGSFWQMPKVNSVGAFGI